jgi:outer membrane murein-binding lipoprotein Lpp
MAKIKNMFFVLLTVAFLSGMIAGCGGVSEEQMKQLNDLKAEVESLQSQVNAKESERNALLKQITEKDAKIKDYMKQCDQAKTNCK